MVETNRGINPISFFPGQDYQTAPPIRSRGGVHPKEVVVVEQLEQVRQELEQSIQVDLTPIEQQLEQERTRALGAEQDLGNRISRVALANIRQIVPCAAITTSLPKDFSSIPGFTPGVPAPEQGRLFVNSIDGTQGYYLAQNGALVRDPNFADVEAFTAGQLVVVRTGGTRYFLATDATAGTASEINADFQFYGDDKGTVSTDIQNGNAARVIDAGNKYEVSLAADPADISQAGNIARLSEARRTQLDNTQEVANQAAADIVQIKQLEQQLVSDNVAQGNALAANSEAIAREHTTNQTQDSLLQEIRTDVNSALTTNQTQDDLLQALRTDLNTEHTSNLNQDTLIQGLRADVNSTLTTNQTQDSLLQALRTDLNTEHTSNLNQDTLIQGLRANVNSTLTTNQTQDSLLQALRTDLNTEHTSNLNQDTLIQGLRTDTDANTAQVALRLTDAQVRALWLQLEQEANPYYWLVSGNASLFTDDVGRNYTRTDFSVSLPAGDWDWIKKQVDTSGTPRKILNTTEDTFVGNTYNISFYTDVDSNNALKPVGDREVKIHFGRSYTGNV